MSGILAESMMAVPTHGALAGQRVLITRAAGEGADDWATAIELAGGIAVRFPTIATIPVVEAQPLDRALAELDQYGWLVLTSQTAVEVVVARLPNRRFPDGLQARIAVVGARTGKAVDLHGGHVALMPDDQRQEGIVAAFATLPSPRTRVLFPHAENARPFLVDKLRAVGHAVDAIVAYRTVSLSDLPPVPPFDVATFASPSALNAFLAAFGMAPLEGKLVAVIGATTASAALRKGLNPVVAARPDGSALISAIERAVIAKEKAHVVP